MDDAIEHTIPSDFLSHRDALLLADLCAEYLRSKDISSDAFGFAVQIMTPTGEEYEPATHKL